ncbi:indole-diterpene biosynthesis protein-like protein PaxU [Plenodomus tracheiphilus IPT5]|uniref:Indole-diterpene biosynthesis protein-like protein PaxU n=1 Tax=Plenodomus tracheiphilus IPT5 TaxID=1408161 RepID=A0A6A7ANG1_9PLEO|nr:indole-diterpene biosynthesis protein-like protein PaxU [Plenodomus tracheiphilus IPT5]
MASPANADPVFDTLGPRMSLFTPQDPAPGQLIILCTWLGAGKKHIAKYTHGYRTIAPHAKILLIESSVWIIASPYTRQWEAIKPAAEVVFAVLADCSNASVKPNIMIHTFSNGGTNSATQLLIVLQKQLGYALPVTGILCDSGPARGTYTKSFHSMLISLPKGLFWRIVGPIIIMFVANLLFGSQLIGWEKPERIYRRTLLDQNLVKCRRICYAFSKADTHVDWEDITSHADDARGKGWDVKELEFDGTPHCNHISKYRAEYFEAMHRVWEGGALEPGPKALLEESSR